MVYALQGGQWLDWLKVTCNFASNMSRVSVDDLSDSIRLRRKTFHKKSLCHSLYKIQLLVLLSTVSYLQVFSFFFFLQGERGARGEAGKPGTPGLAVMSCFAVIFMSNFDHCID